MVLLLSQKTSGNDTSVIGKMDLQALALLRHIIEFGGATKREGSASLGITEAQFVHTLKRLRYTYNFDIKWDHKYKVYVFSSEKFPAGTRAVAEKLEEYNISGKELLSVFDEATMPDFKPITIDTDGDSVVLPTIGDIHCGSKWSRRDILDHFIDRCRREDASKALNLGDTLEGISGRPGHWAQLADGAVTVDRQAEMLEEWFEPFSEAGIEVLSIEASQSHTNWSQNIGNQGL